MNIDGEYSILYLIAGFFAYILYMINAWYCIWQILDKYLFNLSSGLYLVAYTILIILMISVALNIDSNYLNFLCASGFSIFLAYINKIPNFFSHKESKKFCQDRIYKYKTAINIDPHNIAARSALVDYLSILGMFDEAIESQQEILNIQPGNSEEKRKLDKLFLEREEKIRGITVCPSCGFRNYSDLKQCKNCFEALTLKGIFSEKIKKGGRQKFYISVFILISVIILLIGMTTGMPVDIRICLISFFALLSAFSVFVLFYSKI